MRWALVTGLAIAAASGCQARRLGPRSESLGGSLAKGGQKISDVPVRGFPIHVDYTEAETHADRSVNGELLASDADHIWIESWGAVRYVHAQDVRLLRIELYQGQALAVGVWAGLGTISTLSHGVWLIFSAPIWFITGIAATATLASDNDAEAPPASPRPLWQYARFPQGLPASMHNCPVHPPPKPPEPPPAPPTQP
jgi:hypothetical protein